MGEAARRTNGEAYRASQEHVQALLFHRRLEAADDCPLGIAKRSGQVVGFEDHIAGGADGAEEAKQRLLEHAQIAPA